MTKLTRLYLAAALMVVGTMLFVVPAHAKNGPKRAITKIAGDLYRFQNNFHFSVFLVTSDGVIVTDPINAEAATWLKDEIKKRFNKPIRYLILSHDHSDHSSGGEVFADTATVIAHKNAKATIVGESRPTAVPDLTFSDRMTVSLGGKQVELIYVGASHSDNLIVMNFPAERTLFVVDIVSVKRVAYKTLSDSYFPGWIDALKRIEAIDFDILAPGHGPMGIKADVAANRGYMSSLYHGVLNGLRTGETLGSLKSKLTLDGYKDWGRYEEWRPLNIEGIYKRIELQRRAR
jgi:glyoxylase-like metal-dependent hydrolase (beta-lactamase superfamily II)